MGFFAPVGLSAQGCQTNDPANFNFTLVPGGCAVDFAATYAGPGTVTHTWQFYEQPTATGPFSTSNLANPLHTFDAVSQIRLVVHTITITQNGQVTTHTCSRLVDYACDGCSLSSRRFTYAVNGCTVTFTALNTNEPATWTFGDGNTATGTVVTHNYGSNGNFTVILTQNGFTCSKRIRTFCAAMGCCNADFTGSVTRECATLCLNLDAACEMDGQHTWMVSGSPCLTVASLNSSPNQPCIQLTNINTKNTTSVTVTHVLTCPNGTSQTLTKTIPIPTNVGEAVFIGIRRPQPTNLSDFACVIPGLKYPISTAAADALPLYVSGIVQVNKGSPTSSFSFLGADVRMDPGMTGFDVIGKRWLSMGMSKSGTPTTMRAVPDCNCLWRGNQVWSKGKLTTGTAFSQQAGDAIIEDAVFGIRAQPGSVLEIQGTSFRRNFVGIRATEGNFSLLQFRENEFDGQGPLKGICTLNNLIRDIRVPGGGLSPGETFPTLGGPFTPYQTGKGLAGMYLRRLNSFNLLPLSVESQNIFQNLCYGIMAYDCNIDIASNCRFLNLSGGGAYGLRRTGGIFSVDGALNGPNTFRFVGNGQDALPAAFENCVLGIYARSEQGAAPTNINISNTRMEGVRNGVFMDALYLSGAFRGNATNGNFLGIHHNRINASMTVFNHNSVYSNAGITFGDYNPTVSNIEIYNNNVRVSYFTTGDFESVSGGTFGIVGWGLWPGSDPGPNIIELDIHDNRVEVTDMAQAGIGLELHPNGVIRNQRGGNAAAGNGIFMNGTEMWAGITTIEGNRNLVACNEITTTVPPAFLSLLQSRFQTNTDYFRNTMTGPGVGAQFRENCANARFQCNEMNNNTVGLSYTEGAETGDQGTLDVTFGNRWVGNFATGAEADMSVATGLSRYFVRNVNNEAPPSVAAFPGWVNNANANATVGCILENCPALPGMVPPVVVTRLDERVAADSLNYGTLSHATERKWQHRYLLYSKLMDYPQLMQGNALM